MTYSENVVEALPGVDGRDCKIVHCRANGTMTHPKRYLLEGHACIKANGRKRVSERVRVAKLDRRNGVECALDQEVDIIMI